MISACARATRWSDAVGHLSSLKMNTLDTTPTTPGSQGNSSDSNLDDGRIEILEIP